MTLSACYLALSLNGRCHRVRDCPGPGSGGGHGRRGSEGSFGCGLYQLTVKAGSQLKRQSQERFSSPLSLPLTVWSNHLPRHLVKTGLVGAQVRTLSSTCSNSPTPWICRLREPSCKKCSTPLMNAKPDDTWLADLGPAAQTRLVPPHTVYRFPRLHLEICNETRLHYRLASCNIP